MVEGVTGRFEAIGCSTAVAVRVGAGRVGCVVGGTGLRIGTVRFTGAVAASSA